ncbi:diaminopimelate epimerase [Palleronia pelagia]|uniref:diaminopimelate epimerase n=1 Tax=Palleronia pelagia TaxID=387096 RepID=UPI0015877F32|nr:diaminopimelate epimerase [Palleronia pelagia]
MPQDQTDVPFMKMHGLGNDFIVIDRRHRDVPVTAALARALGDRRRGLGFDQLATIDPCDGADARLTFWNSDGSPSGACGNATRCIARHLMDEGRDAVTLRTDRGDLTARDAGDGLTSVNMGAPVLDWRSVPLARDVDLDHLPLDGDPVATGMGNPHCTFFVDNVEAVDLDEIGPRVEHDPLYPERTNVQLAQLTGPDHFRVRVWERGAGVTLASGSSSCAVAVAAARRGLTARRVCIDLDGGTLWIDWREDGVWMTGPTAHVADGLIRADWIAGQS